MKTIFANVTPIIKSAVSIVRVSGGLSSSVLYSLTRQNDLSPRKAHLLSLFHPKTGEMIDSALVFFFNAPHSFTGEDVVEFHLHGSRAVVLHCLDALSSINGLYFAEPGEFSKRAFENGKMDLTEAEGLADLIDSETLAQKQQALMQMKGGLKHHYDAWRSQLIDLMAIVEAYIDFPDEELPVEHINRINNHILHIIEELTKHLNDNRRGELLRNGIRATIVGPPNAGKSTLLNYLSKRDVAIVSDIAGTTRDVLEVHLDIQGYPFILADTAGIHVQTTDQIEKIGIERALQKATESDVLLIILDISSNNAHIDPSVLALAEEHPHTHILINKIDTDKSVELPNELVPYNPLLISARTGKGIDQLIQSLAEFATTIFNHPEDPIITRQRHRLLLTDTLNSLTSITLEEPLEIVAEKLRTAATSLGCVTGHIGVEDILDSLFSHFCIGK